MSLAIQMLIVSQFLVILTLFTHALLALFFTLTLTLLGLFRLFRFAGD